MTCLESVVSFAEINQWPLDFISRTHAHVRDLLLRGRDKDRDRQRQTDNQRQIDRQTDRQRETEKVRQEDAQTSRHKDRQQETQTDKQTHCSMSHPFSLFPFHAKPGLTRLGQGRRICAVHRKGCPLDFSYIPSWRCWWPRWW